MKQHLTLAKDIILKHTPYRLMAAVFMLVGLSANAQIINTVAGSSSFTATDGVPATASGLYGVSSVAADANGNYYIADSHNYRIRKVDAAGIVTTVAGTGTAGYSGDGSAATAAMIDGDAVAVDAAGNLYIEDYSNRRIRKVNALGVISTVAGCGVCGTSFTEGGPATAGDLGGVQGGIALDGAGNLYIAGEGNYYIIRISPSGIVHFVAGNGTGGYTGDGGPATVAEINCNLDYYCGIAVDGPGNVYFSDASNDVVRKVSTSGVITTVAGIGTGGYSGDGGAATDAKLYAPEGVALDTAGNLYISDRVNGRIRKVSTAGIISTYAGGGSIVMPPGDGVPAVSASLGSISLYGISVDEANNIYVASSNTFNYILKINSVIGNMSVCLGSTTSLSDPVSGGVWSSSNTSYATVSSSGIVTGVALGQAIITYSAGPLVATANVTVNPYPSAVTGASSVCAGAIITLSSLPTGGAWSSGTTTVATISSSGAAAGHLTGVAAGTSVISYTLASGCGVMEVVTVNPLPAAGTITGIASVCAGETTPLSDATSGGVWSSGAASVATIGSTGIVTGASAGTSIITYTFTNSCGSASVHQTVTVNPLALAGTITGTAAVCIPATASLTDAASGGVWSSGSTGIATVGSAGIVTGVSDGTAIVSYTVTNGCGPVSAYRAVTVNSTPSAGVITGVAFVCAGSTTPLGDGVGGGVWSSVSTSIATINSVGTASGVSAGTATISYTVTNGCGTVSATAIFTVNPLPISGTITGSATGCVGAATALTDGASGGTWSSGSTGIATVSSGGAVTGLAAGTAVITYAVTNSCGTATATAVETISLPPDAGTITGVTTVCAGATTTLSDGTGGGVWSSGTTAVATVSSGGVVTGASGGTVAISYTVTNSCGSASATAFVMVNPLPNAGTITGATSVCDGATTALTDAAGGGSWSSSSTSVATVDGTGVVTGVAIGASTISYSVTNSCGTTNAILNITVDNCPGAGVGTINGQAGIKIYPNPAQSIIYIDAPFKVNASLMTIEGKLVESVNNTTELNLDGIAAGVYLVVIYDENGVKLQTSKIIKTE